MRSAVGQVLGTRSSSDVTTGEIPWKTEFGSLLYNLRHYPNDEVLQGVASLYVAEAIQRWEPRVLVNNIVFERGTTTEGGQNILIIRIGYDIIQRNVAGNQVILPDVQQVLQVEI